MCDNKNSPVLHVAFYPWFAYGHLMPFLHLANKLAERGHKISFFLPTKTQPKLAAHNHHPNHLSFIPITVPSIDGLPPGAETTNDVSVSGRPLIMAAMDMTQDTIEAHLVRLKPNVVLYDFTYWMPELARKHGIKAVHYITANISRYAYFAPHLKADNQRLTVAKLVAPPPGFPSQSVGMNAREAEVVVGTLEMKFGVGDLTLGERLGKSFLECDAVGVKSCKEMEGAYAEYFEKIFGKQVLLAGPMVPKPPSEKLHEHFNGWLNGFSDSTVIYCALGSECVLGENQFQELLLGLELTGTSLSIVFELMDGLGWAGTLSFVCPHCHGSNNEGPGSK